MEKTECALFNRQVLVEVWMVILSFRPESFLQGLLYGCWLHLLDRSQVMRDDQTRLQCETNRVLMQQAT